MSNALVTGASRGIGAAIVRALSEDAGVEQVVAVARTGMRGASAKVHAHQIDCTDESALTALATSSDAPVHLLIHCIGALEFGPGTPEKRLGEVNPEALLDAFRTNVVAAALVLKTFAARLRAGRGVAALLSARVGSIGDNRMGGWYGYRISKAALNQLVRTAAIELARGGSTARVIAVHPGTTHTGLSERFVARRSGVATADETARRIIDLTRAVTSEQSGTLLNWDGSLLPW